jgi:DNA polymerase-3 subunit delta'
MEKDPKKMNWPAIGNDTAIEFLSRSLINEKIAQTYVFTGPDDLGKSTIALAYAKNLQGEAAGFNSDLHILEPLPEKKSISIEQVREFIKTLNLSSFSDSYKIGIIKQADLLSEEAKSALLKTLEEPTEKTTIILLVSDENSLPKTILSRAQVLYFYPVKAGIIYDYLIKECGANRSLAKDLASLVLGRPLKALHFLENADHYSAYLAKAETIINFFKEDLNSRLGNLDKIYNDKSYSKQAVVSAQEVLEISEGIMRDLLLLNLGESDLLQHVMLKDKLMEAKAAIELTYGDNSGAYILSKMSLISDARKYLNSNVNPRLVLEQFLINL